MAHGFVIDRADGSQRKVSGYKFKAANPNAKRYAASASSVSNLPPKVDLRGQLTPVENQGELSSCVANACAGAYEYLVKQHRGDDAYDVSRLFVYYNARAREGAEGEDEGSIIADAIEGLREKGACSEETWPYDEEMVNEQPSDEAFEEASQFLVEDVQLVPTTLQAWKTALAEGYPIIFGISLYESFDKQKRKGLVPMPTTTESSRASHGGHSMLCVGYSDPDKLFIIRNSWGEDWGDNGYCYIPYDYLMNKKFNDGDSWIIRQVESVEVDESTWGDEESIVGDFDTELAKMSDEDFQAMIDAMGKFHLETRIALIFLRAAGADGDISESEIAEFQGYVVEVLKDLGSSYDADKVLRHALKHVEDDALVESSIQLLGAHVPKTMLASILASLREIVGTDGLAEEEEEFLAELVEAWQVEEGDGEAADEEGSDDEDDEDDEDEDDEDEDEDEEGDDEDEDEDDDDDEEDEDEEEES